MAGRGLLAEEQGAQVIAQSDGNDGEVCAQGKHREERKEVLEHGNVRYYGVACVAVWLEVEGVHVVQLRKSENAREAEQGVEAQDERVVGSQQGKQVLLLPPRGDQRRQRVVAHERVDAHPKQVGQARGDCHGGVALTLALTQGECTQQDHRDECNPPHQRCKDLQILGLLHIEEGEWPNETQEHQQEYPVSISTGDGGVLPAWQVT